MDELNEALKHGSKEGRREVLDEIFKAIGDLQTELESELVARREDLDRAVWLYSIASEEERSHNSSKLWLEMCADAVKDAEKGLADFLSTLWDLKTNPWDRIGEYRDRVTFRKMREAQAAEPARQEAAPRERPAPTRPRKKGGRPDDALKKTIKQMNADLDAGAVTEDKLRRMPITALASGYKVHRDVANAARERVLKDRAAARNAACGNSVVEFPQQKTV